MSGSQSTLRSTRTAVLAGAGVAGLASVFAFAPLAHAEPAGPNITVPSDNESSTSTEETPAPVMKAEYGKQKFRVGVRGKDGAYYPTGTSTAKTDFSVTETDAEGEATTFPCTSEANNSGDVLDATFCPGLFLGGENDRRAASVNEPTPGEPSFYYIAQPGTRVTVTQTTVRPNLVKDTSTATLEPCEVDESGDEYCSEPNPDSESSRDKSTDLIFVDPGIPPVATDDGAKTKEGVPVTIDIAPNDTAKAPIKTVKIVADPKHGAARLITAEEPDPAPSSSAATTPPLELKAPAGSRALASVTSYKAIYTPKPGFVGIDTFDYTVATANGTATARVTVTVTGVAESGSASAAASSNADAVAETGAPSGQLLGYGVALVVAGGGAVALGTKRRRGRHAR